MKGGQKKMDFRVPLFQPRRPWHASGFVPEGSDPFSRDVVTIPRDKLGGIGMPAALCRGL